MNCNLGKIRFSIIIPAYNAAQTVGRCLESVKKQTYKNFEVIIVDDCSTDNTYSIIEKCIDGDKRFKLYRLKQNSGPSAARNYGLEKSGGGYITFVDADDYVCHQWLEMVNERFENTDADVVFYEYYRQDADGRLSRRRLPELQGTFFEDTVALTNNDTFGYTWIKAIKRSVIGKVRFDDTLALFEDEVFTCAVLSEENVNIACCYEPLYIYVADNPLSLSRKMNPEYPYCCEKVYQAWKNLLGGRMDELLTQKAEHMLENCRWYGLEKKVNPISFWSKLTSCDFLKMVTMDDSFCKAVKAGNKLRLLLYWMQYRIKVNLSSLKR